MTKELMKIDFTSDQINLIKSQIAPKATKEELELFLYQARRTGLDPMVRQIYAIHRWNSQQNKEVMTIQTSIDGFRVIAERSGDYAGQDEPVFEYKPDGSILKCTIKVYRWHNEQRYQSAVGVAFWDEYAQKDKTGKLTTMWLKMGHVMISKVAEALALRKSYPQDLSGLYTGDEMEQAAPITQDISHEEIKEHPLPKKLAEDEIGGLSLQVFEQWQEQIEGCKNIAELTKLFKGNEGTINSEPKIFTLFSNRKKQLLAS